MYIRSAYEKKKYFVIHSNFFYPGAEKESTWRQKSEECTKKCFLPCSILFQFPQYTNFGENG